MPDHMQMLVNVPTLIVHLPLHCSGRGVGPDPDPDPETPSPARADPAPSDPDDPDHDDPVRAHHTVEGAVPTDIDT